MDDIYKNLFGYIITQVLTVVLAILIVTYYPFKGYKYIAVLMIIISLIGDFFIYLNSNIYGK